ncbi:MAG: DNA-formamidopyrimidine glycosylase family protein, partial [Lacisediminihabitans sp.]
MPELPEVEVVRAGLEPAVCGATVVSVAVLDERSLRRHPGPSEDFVERLTGHSFSAAVRRGKFLWLPLAASLIEPVKTPHPISQARSALGSRDRWRDHLSSTALVVHLGMSGQVLLRTPDAADDALTRIRLEL